MSRIGSHEREIKLAVSDAAEGMRRLLECGFRVTRPRTFESNAVFDKADGSLRAAGCVLRLRSAGGHSTITWKGPADAGIHKIREEVEFLASDGPAARLLFQRLGYGEMFVYEKYRTELGRASDAGSATLDETPIGVYIELEGEADWIDSAAAELGFATSDYIVDSYGGLYISWCRARGIVVADMTF